MRQLERLQRAEARAGHPLLANGLHDWLAVLGGHRCRQGEPHVGARRVGVPARPDDRVAQPQGKGIAEIGQGLRVVHALRAVGDVAEQHLAAAIVDLVEKPPVAAGGIPRPKNEDTGRVLDPAGGIARRLVDQGDAAVGRRGGIDFAAGDGDDALIGAHLAERRAIGQRLDLLDLEREEH